MNSQYVVIIFEVRENDDPLVTGVVGPFDDEGVAIDWCDNVGKVGHCYHVAPIIQPYTKER